MSATVTRINTHRAVCPCGAQSVLSPVITFDNNGPHIDAVATVTFGTRQNPWGDAHVLPFLTDSTVRWNCPACDRAN